MMIFKRSRAGYAAIIMVLSWVGAHGQDIKRGNSEGIATRLSVSNERPLPFESLEVVVSLKNEAGRQTRVVASWSVSLDFGAVNGEKVEWRSYTPHNEPIASPTIPTAWDFAPDEIKELYWHIDYDAVSGQHVFPRAGRYRLRAAASYDTRFISNEVEVVVREPAGVDAKAFEFLQKNKVHRYFSESSVEKYPRTNRNARALEQFINNFEGGEYSNLARIGLALMWMKGVDERTDLVRAKELLTHVTLKTTDPLTARAHYYLGTIWRQRGNDAKAREAFQAVLSGKPDPYFASLAKAALGSPK